ncbi:hypothetical protein JJC00_18755 [Bradyrhizobium diazoefficiens]|uniref:hypothetical protein n=1 Tax=Bradyrhizobium diazoefficiens TaxID=1355477 RepID=UPI00190A3BA4|nr:hypothetical protein [Bradyrhizobium diazoefficiens]QQO37470.1 hypothetical protein JJC00_18755 [Bradyrhizobium diazoefficiens]
MADYDDDQDEQAQDPVSKAVIERDGKSSRNWLKLIDEAQSTYQTWQDKSDSIDKLFANLEQLANVGRDRQFQLFWANVSVLAPAMYSRPPVPVVIPRFKDRRALPRQASELLERASIVNSELEDLHDVLKQIRDDLALNGRGVPWLRYEATGRGKDFKERVCIEHKDRKDWLCEPARKWKEVDWVASRGWMTRSEMRKRFKKTSGDAYKDAVFARRREDKEVDDGRKKAGVWELWSKSQNKVVWVADGVEVVLDEGAPHLTLDGFFPCPRPAYGTLQRRTLIPVPDFLYYKDQLEEINETTARIAALQPSLKVKGFYPGGAGDLSDAIEAAVNAVSDNQVLVPVANWALLGNGSAKDTIVWLPLEQVVTAIKELVALRKQMIDDVYQITGLSDIMRGETEASETLGAQQLKSQYGSIRISDRRDEMVRIARDVIRIAAEIMSENFSQKTFLEMTQLEVPTEAQMAEQAKPLQAQLVQVQRELAQAQSDPETRAYAQQNPQAAQQILGQAQQHIAQIQGQLQKLSQVPTIEKIMALLREQKLRPYVLDIETNSTIEPDENAQKQRATEFTTAIGGFLKEALPLVQTMPQAAPLAAETLKYVASQFRAGRSLEAVIDEFADQMAQMASQPKPPDPKQAQEAAAAQVAAQKAQADAQATQADAAERSAKAQAMVAEAQAKTLQAQSDGADAEQERKTRLQEAADAAEARRIERAGKIATTNKQIELMTAQGARDQAKDELTLKKSALEIDLMNAKIDQAKMPPPAPPAAAA